MGNVKVESETGLVQREELNIGEDVLLGFYFSKVLLKYGISSNSSNTNEVWKFVRIKELRFMRFSIWKDLAGSEDEGILCDEEMQENNWIFF